MSKSHILLVEDDAGLCEALTDTLCMGGYQVTPVASAEDAVVQVKQHTYDMIISDVQMAGMSGLNLLNTVKTQFPKLPMVLMTAYANIDDAITAMRNGATDYLSKPFAPEVLLNLVGRYAPAHRVPSRTPIVGDASSEQTLAIARKVAGSDATVMVLGPSGSGKEVLSRYVHDQSSRRDGPFVAINCAAIPENMLEATLFGYEKGAFTGAIQACPGKFEQAQAGTILLDEITEMDLSLQAKLLRVLQEREVERLGGKKTIKLDVRVIATSNRDLMLAVRDGKFREDLYYRLNVFPISWLPLAQRPGDIIPLAEHLLERHAASQNRPIPRLNPEATRCLKSYDWPGNVRELENVIQRALILNQDGDISAHDILLEGRAQEVFEFGTADDSAGSTAIKPTNTEDSEPEGEPKLGVELQQQEQTIILEALAQANGKRKDVAERLGISPRTLRYKLAKMREQGVELPL